MQLRTDLLVDEMAPSEGENGYLYLGCCRLLTWAVRSVTMQATPQKAIDVGSKRFEI